MVVEFEIGIVKMAEQKIEVGKFPVKPVKADRKIRANKVAHNTGTQKERTRPATAVVCTN